MTATIYNCQVTINDSNGEPLIVKNVFAMRNILRSLFNVVNNQATISDASNVKAFRKEYKIKSMPDSILLRWLEGSINTATIDVKTA